MNENLTKLPRILIVDDVHPVLITLLETAKAEVLYMPQCTRSQAKEHIAHCDGLVIRSKFFVDADFLEHAPQLKFIARSGAGLDNIDAAAAMARQITLIAANEGNCDAVGEHLVGMLLNLMNNLHKAHEQIRNQQWFREENRGYELKGSTVALIGYGHNGRAMAQKLSGFGVEVIAYDKYKTGFSDAWAKEVSMEEVVRNADVLSFHIPLTQETKGLVTIEYLRHFRKPIFFLMGARGGIVNMQAVLHGLDSGAIRGAAFDVLPVETFPALAEQPWFDDLIARDNVLISPHVAGWTFESYYKLSEVLGQKIGSWIANFYHTE